MNSVGVKDWTDELTINDSNGVVKVSTQRRIHVTKRKRKIKSIHYLLLGNPLLKQIWSCSCTESLDPLLSGNKQLEHDSFVSILSLQISTLKNKAERTFYGDKLLSTYNIKRIF